MAGLLPLELVAIDTEGQKLASRNQSLATSTAHAQSGAERERGHVPGPFAHFRTRGLETHLAREL